MKGEKAMNNSNAPKIQQDNIINIKVTIERKDKVRYTKDGSIDNRKSNKQAGKDSEVYAFKSKEEIAAMITVFNRYIDNAPTEYKCQLARRNKMMFLIGMNIGIRASDLRTLRWSFFFNNDGSFKDFYTIQPLKQRKQKKFVKIYFNNTVRKAITDYLYYYPIENLEDFLFPSQKGSDSITERTLYDIVKSAAKEADIKQNIGSHSLRKSWGFWCWHEAEDKAKAVVILQKCFNHKDTLTTLKYIGVLDEEISDMYNSVELGLDYL